MSGLESRELKQAMLERSVIGSVIMGDALPSSLQLEAAHFCDPLCARLFALLSRMEAQRQEISLPGVCMADDALDASAVVELTQEACVSEVIIRQHCVMLREQGMRRLLLALLAQEESALQSGAPPLERIRSLGDRLAGLMSAGSEERHDPTMFEAIMHLLDQMRGEENIEQPPIASGISAVDKCLSGGFRPGDLAIIAALTSVGKSAMLSFMMRNAAAQGKRILLVSCEMSAEQNAERYLAAMSGVDIGRIIRREQMTEQENVQISDGMQIYHPENIVMIASGTQTVSSVRRAALSMQMTTGLDMIVVDYLQRLRPDRTSANKADEVGSIASGLKSLAVDLNVPVLTAAQFNREAAKGRSDARGNADVGVPALHQLRDSSQIEDEANTVIILDEPSRALGTSRRQINAHIVKNRSGMLCAVHLFFDPNTMTYEAA